MTLNYLIVSNTPFPQWEKELGAKVTYIEKFENPDEWARLIHEHYRRANALITDLAPRWAMDNDSIGVEGLNGINAILGAKENALPSFIYTPYVSEQIVSIAYKNDCNAVVNSYKYSITDLKDIIDQTISKDKNDPDRVWIDTEHLPTFVSNVAIAATDTTLGILTHSETMLFLHIVSNEDYEQVAAVTGYKAGTLRNKASEIFQKCGFKNRQRASLHAVRIGISGVV